MVGDRSTWNTDVLRRPDIWILFCLLTVSDHTHTLALLVGGVRFDTGDLCSGSVCVCVCLSVRVRGESLCGSGELPVFLRSAGDDGWLG